MGLEFEHAELCAQTHDLVQQFNLLHCHTTATTTTTTILQELEFPRLNGG